MQQVRPVDELRAEWRELCEEENKPIIVPREHAEWARSVTPHVSLDGLRGSIVQFEGINASGKKTQAYWLRDAVKGLGVNAEVFSFPNYNTDIGFIIYCYLNNESVDHRGEPIQDPKYWYEQNRVEATSKIKEIIKAGGVVIYDRGADSNKAHQGAKLETDDEVAYLIKLVDQTEYVENGFPRPDLSFHLSMPALVSARLLKERAEKTGLKLDEHEKNVRKQQRAEEIYGLVAGIESDRWRTIDCCEGDSLRKKYDIAKDVYRLTIDKFLK
ncbi:MAG: dTMP kinase [Candidatus Nanoarchaeia archaeon]